MGEAKRRGTYDQRKVAAILRDAETRARIVAERQADNAAKWSAMTEAQRVSYVRTVAARVDKLNAFLAVGGMAPNYNSLFLAFDGIPKDELKAVRDLIGEQDAARKTVIVG